MTIDTSDVPFGKLSDTIYAGGAQTTAGVPNTLQVALAGHGYIINLREQPGFPGYKRQTLPAIRQPVDQSVEPGEQSISSEGLWRRAQDTWVLGAGQEYLDNRANLFSLYVRSGEGQSFRSRFYRSKGINPWVDGHLTLLNDVTLGWASVNTNLKMVVANGIVYLIDGQQLLFSTDGLTWTVVTGNPAATARDLTTDGNTVWVAYGASGIYSTTSGSASMASFSAQAATFILLGNGRLIAGNVNVLYEIAMAGTATVIVTYPNTATTFTAGTSAPEAVYVGTTIGDRSYFYAIANIAATGVLGVPTWAGTLPAGETIKTMAYYDGTVLLGTSRGLRRAALSSQSTSASLVHGPSISALGAVTALEARGQYCYFGITAFPDFTDPTGATKSSGLARADLAHDTSAGFPSWATDLLAPNGIVGTTLSAVTLVVGGVDTLCFAVSGSGVYVRNTNLVATGNIDSGWIRYGTTEKKAVTAIEPRHDPLPAGASVGMALIQEDLSVLTLATSSLAGSLGPPAPYTANLTIAEKAQVRITLNRATVITAGPDLHRYVLKALVTPRRIDEILLPIIMRTRVSTIQGPEGGDQVFDTLNEYLYLRSLANAGTIVSYQEGNSTYSVWIDQLTVLPEKWRDDRAFFEGIILCRLLTVEN